MFFLAIFGFYTLKDFQRYQERLKRSSDEKVMSETKLKVKNVGYSENFRFRYVCEIFVMSKSENF